MCGDMLWWIPKILHAEWAQRRGEKSFWLIHRPSQIWNSQHKPSAMASIKLVDGIAESFRKEPRRARRKIFDVKNPQQYLHRPLKHPNGYGTSVHIMLYTSSVAVAIRERVPGHVLGGSMKKEKSFWFRMRIIRGRTGARRSPNKSQSKQDQKNIKSSLQQQQQPHNNHNISRALAVFPHYMWLCVCTLGSSGEFALDFS